MAGQGDLLHASAVAFGHRGILILGASGSGKSTLALQLLSLGADLVADDRVQVAALPEGGVRLSAPEAIAGRIEAREFGLLTLPYRPALATLVVDMDQTETRRLPEERQIVIAGAPLRLIAKVESPAFPAMLALHLKDS